MERLRNPYSGLGQYCLHLGHAFAAEKGAKDLDFACLVPAERVGEFGETMRYKAVRPWHKIFGPDFGESLWHCMHQDSNYTPRRRKTKLIYTIHDLNFLDRPDYSAAKKQHRLTALQAKINRANGLVYISEYVQDWVHANLIVAQDTLEKVIYNGGRLTVDGGRWTVDGGRWTVDGGRRTADGGRLTVDGGRWTVDGGRWTVDGGRRTVDGGRLTADGGRWTVDGGRRTADGNAAPHPASLIPPPSSLIPPPSSLLPPPSSLPPFLFSIGIHPKKNYHVLMPILAENKGYQWIIAGPDSRGYRAKIEQEAQRWGVADRINFCGPVGNEEKRNYYEQCSALLFPSLSEGFGLPVVEAMSLGKPVFLSDRTSLPEIGGKEAYYFSDFEPENLCKTFREGMQQFEKDPDKPARMIAWANQFSWEKAADQYLEFYQQLLN
ncbi:MAG: glycosyltransferase [Saprospiraceae bacterium]|nr:glycosyltransferase [Saprospiraceae bacterium]